MFVHLIPNLSFKSINLVFDPLARPSLTLTVSFSFPCKLGGCGFHDVYRFASNNHLFSRKMLVLIRLLGRRVEQDQSGDFCVIDKTTMIINNSTDASIK